MTLDVPHQRRSVEDPDALSEQELAMLDFERRWWDYAGARAQAVRKAFGLSLERYEEFLDALIERPQALSADPVTVARLRRRRDGRLARRE